MNKTTFLPYAILMTLLFSLLSCQDAESPQNQQVFKTSDKAKLTNAEQVKNCSFSKQTNWWTKSFDSLPADVANNLVTGSPEFCEFYQFSQDYFLFLISPSSTPGVANLEDQANFPLLETSGTNSCDDTYPSHSLNVRNVKNENDKSGFIIPERIDQAGANAIYDQQGNVVFYEIRFTKNLCDYPAIQSKPNFPGKTVEMKMAWRVLNATDNTSDFYTTNTTINGKDYKLGLIGWHIVVTADNHPEMVWITLDHQRNAIACDNIGPKQPAFNFTSHSCSQNKAQCNNLNKTLKSKLLKLPAGTKPNDICQSFPYGTLKDQAITTRDGLNIALIKKLNEELQNKIFKQAGLPASLSVWKNYRFTGALWISDIKLNSSDKTNQRGSLELANTVMETSFQGTTGKPGSAFNCFICHNYSGTSSGTSNTQDAARLSHIFDDIISGQKCSDVQASHLINNQSQAERTCPNTCNNKSSNLAWNGQWTNQDATTGKQLPMTVCGCCSK